VRAPSGRARVTAPSPSHQIATLRSLLNVRLDQRRSPGVAAIAGRPAIMTGMTTTLITGATRGLGREAARRLIELGHVVYLGARDAAAGQKAADEIGARVLTLDVTDEASVMAAARRLGSEAGALDVLVNNAGIAGEQRPPADASIDDMTRVFDTNVLGPVRVLKAFTPLLEASPAPVVVDVSSAVGSLTRNSDPAAPWKMLAYPMSKAALNMLTVQYAKAYPRWRVNAVTPGLTATEFTPGQGGWSVEEGARVIVRMATIGPDGPTGTFVEDAGVVPW
jgi:NAD(P)-dependent dehydrogenase (short-subunit alcohol dehydrogenase family)